MKLEKKRDARPKKPRPSDHGQRCMYIHRWNTNKQAAEPAAFFIGPRITVLGAVPSGVQEGLQAL